MTFTRRDTLIIGAAGAAAAALPSAGFAAADKTAEAIAAFTGGAAVTEGGVDIGAPEIAENGNTVPIEVGAEGAAEILVLADGNPSPGVATFRFSKLAVPAASTRIRLAGTQNVVAVAKMQDGSFRQAQRTVKVTIGGCGG
ncbi:thiosulfate oxidation carrier protein SoxY [Rhodovulum sp. DZ06]|uniref:thiosulfate oxidation carrier protein SoxY n=1 Tax=Rhodovulum sp. DZ06 TaxID=3425126 RepID=UPI003D32BD03